MPRNAKSYLSCNAFGGGNSIFYILGQVESRIQAVAIYHLEQ